MERIKCSYTDCNHYFESEADMKRHKKKDPDHFYCHKCNVDCDDDLNYMIHQITSSKHIVCPACGMEFKSSSGRDRHVEIMHAASQRISCRGCQIMFTKASTLMRHIENDECRVIRLKDFHRERAERAVEKEAFQQMLDPMSGSAIDKASTAPTVYSDGTENSQGGVSLLENDGPHVARDWQGRPIDRHIPIQPAQAGPYRAPQPQPEGPTITALSKFPALPVSNKPRPPSKAPTDDLMDVNEAGEKLSDMSINQTSAWAQSQTASHLFPQQPTTEETSPPAADTDSKYDNLSEVSFRTYGSQSRVGTFLEQATQPGLNRPPPPIPSSPPSTTTYSHITTTPLARISTLQMDNYYDAIREAYVCPGQQCQRPFRTPDQFQAHLLSPAHVGGHVTCASCLNRFKTNAALLSHMESGSKNCNVRHSTNYNQVLREVSAGLIGTSGHLEDGTVRYMMPGDEGWGTL